MIFRTVRKNIRKELLLNLLTCLQLAAAMTAVVIMISAFSLRYRYYSALKDELNSKGIYSIFSLGQMLNNNEFLDDQGVLSKLSGAKRIIGTAEPFACRTVQHEHDTRILAYTDNLVTAYQPKLLSGKWLSSAAEAEMQEIVVQQNSFGWKTGDEIEIEFYCQDGSMRRYPFRVSGVFKSETKLPGGAGTDLQNLNYSYFYETCDHLAPGRTLLIANLETLKRLDSEIVIGMTGSSLISFADDITDEQLEENQNILLESGAYTAESLQRLQPGNRRYLLRQLYDQFPVILVLLILTCVSCMSSSALTTRSRLRDYAVFYVCGLRWKQCVRLSLMQALLCCVVSFCAAAVILNTIRVTPLADRFYVAWSAESILGIGVISVVYLIASMLMPLHLIGHNTPKQILTGDRT